jgi:hypothetical protein
MAIHLFIGESSTGFFYVKKERESQLSIFMRKCSLHSLVDFSL